VIVVELPTIEPRSEHQDLRLLHAARDGNLNAVTVLITEAVDVNGSDAKGDTALTYAAMAGHPTIVDTLLRAGADFRMVTTDGWDAYHVAMFYGDVRGEIMSPYDEIMKMLIAHGYDPKASR